MRAYFVPGTLLGPGGQDVNRKDKTAGLRQWQSHRGLPQMLMMLVIQDSDITEIGDLAADSLL